MDKHANFFFVLKIHTKGRANNEHGKIFQGVWVWGRKGGGDLMHYYFIFFRVLLLLLFRLHYYCCLLFFFLFFLPPPFAMQIRVMLSDGAQFACIYVCVVCVLVLGEELLF